MSCIIKYSDDYIQKQQMKSNEIATHIANLYLETHPREISYGVTLTSSEDDSEGTFYHHLSDEKYNVIKKCSTIAAETDCSLEEIMHAEGYDDLVEELTINESPFAFDRLSSVDLDNPAKFAYFSIQSVRDDRTLGSDTPIGIMLNDEDFKKLLVEHLLYSNRYSMNMLVYRRPMLAQKIMRDLSYASMDWICENTNDFIVNMNQIRQVCDDILNPFIDVLNLFDTEDSDTTLFVIGHQIVPECGEANEIYVNHEDDHYQVQMHFIGRKIMFSQEGVTKDGQFFDDDSFAIDASVVMERFALQKPEDIYPYLKEHFSNKDCFYCLQKKFK